MVLQFELCDRNKLNLKYIYYINKVQNVITMQWCKDPPF